MASVRVKIGDAIEFAAQDAATSSNSSMFTSGRVMDVNPQEPDRCTVQISSYEPLRNLQLQHHAFKIVYGVGDISVLSPRMKGWYIEIKSDIHHDTERGVIKRVDSDINCALVAFESGKKEWLDLTLTAFKVIVEQQQQQQSSENNLDGSMVLNQDLSQNVETMEDQASAPDSEFHLTPPNFHESEKSTMVHANDSALKKFPTIPILTLPKHASSSQEDPQMATHFASKSLPDSDPTTFDWYAEGSHVELCDIHGGFIEGAILCAKSDNHMHLYNEHHQFFEVPLAAQSFKVVIHGLLSLKTIPMGQTVEVYSAMAGAFQPGTVIKTAEVSKLAPIRYANGAVEWIDLSTQTFKLVFLSESNLLPAESDEPFELQSPQHLESPDTRHHHRHVTPLTLPALTIGQRIEVFEAKSKQYTKYTVVDVSELVSHEYTLTSQASLSVRVNLINLRCRIPLTSHMWLEYCHVLPGHRIDIYDKTDKSVVNAKIIMIGSMEENRQPAMVVRYKDGQKRWIHAHSVKIKLRLHGEPLSSNDEESHNSLHHHTMPTSDSAVISSGKSEIKLKSNLVPDEAGEMSKRLAIPPVHEIDRPTTKPDLSRSHSDHQLLSPATASATHLPHLTHFASSTDLHTDKFLPIDSMEMTQTIPSFVQRLDFSTLPTFTNSPLRESEKDESAYAVAASFTPPSFTAASSSNSQSSAGVNHSSNRVAYTMDDLWEEERDELSDGESGIVYVHVATGVRRLAPLPEWLRRCNQITGQLYAVHTTTNTAYSLSGRGNSALGSARSLSRRESSSGGRSVPIGPLEAVRNADLLEQLPTLTNM